MIHYLLRLRPIFRKLRLKKRVYHSELEADPPKQDQVKNDPIKVDHAAIRSVDHAAIRSVDPYDFQVMHQRLAWLFRSSVGLNFVLAAALIISLSSFQAILPLKEVRVALLRIDPEESRIYRIEPIHKDVPGFELLLEQKAQEFVLSLMSVNSVTQRELFAGAMTLASNELRRQITRDFIEGNLIDAVLEANITRQIKIVGVDHIFSLQPNTYKLVVDFDQQDYRDNELIESKELRAYLSMTTVQETVSEAEKYENPLGIRVFDMAINFRGTQSKPTNQQD